MLCKTERSLSRSDVVADLESVVVNLEDGSAQLSDGGEERAAAVPDEATFEIALERQTDGDGGDYSELEFELSWTE